MFETQSCEVWADPHVSGFDNTENQGPSSLALLQKDKTLNNVLQRTAVGMTSFVGRPVDVNAYESGDFWLVKSQPIYIQGRFRLSGEFKPDRAAIGAVAIGGPFLKKHKLIVEPLDGQVSFDGKTLEDGVFQLTKSGGHDVALKVQQDGHGGVEMILPMNVKLLFRRMAKHVDVKITMPKIKGGVDGECGNNDGIAENDDEETVQSRMGAMMVDDNMLLFPREAKGKNGQTDRMVDSEGVARGEGFSNVKQQAKAEAMADAEAKRQAVAQAKADAMAEKQARAQAAALAKAEAAKAKGDAHAEKQARAEAAAMAKAAAAVAKVEAQAEKQARAEAAAMAKAAAAADAEEARAEQKAAVEATAEKVAEEKARAEEKAEHEREIAAGKEEIAAARAAHQEETATKMEAAMEAKEAARAEAAAKAQAAAQQKEEATCPSWCLTNVKTWDQRCQWMAACKTCPICEAKAVKQAALAAAAEKKAEENARTEAKEETKAENAANRQAHRDDIAAEHQANADAREEAKADAAAIKEAKEEASSEFGGGAGSGSGQGSGFGSGVQGSGGGEGSSKLQASEDSRDEML